MTLEELKAQLEIAEEKYNSAIVENNVSSVSESGRTVTYDDKYLDRLEKHINSLKRQIANLEGKCTSGPLYP